ncbi:DUF2523 family protein [Neptunomonas antarctica]|uniref:DUF2523 domain-containing protein n=1 Tax=Neptunomonas antarctica TaxID=619304 RepID=A0A1N7J5J8_9GAMM|nr:DUF2523 family protein [Neptunomonas antarctica]SIS44658.1 Protein of unknown function [Neptunomonas antarctica]
MMWGTILTFIFSIAGPLVFTIIRIIGVSAVTFLGMNLAVGFAVDYMLDNYNGLPSQLLGLMDLCGANSGLVMIGATMSSVATFKAVNRLNSVWRAPGSGPKPWNA